MINLAPQISEWRNLSSTLKFCVFSVEPANGVDCSIHQPTLVAAHDGVLICLSSSSGMAKSSVDGVLSLALSELHEKIRDGGESTLLRKLQRETWQQFQRGLFDRAVPDIMAVVAEESTALSAWRAGPNGIARLENGTIALVSEDLRIAALKRLGVALGPQWSHDSLLAELSELTQIEPPAASRQELTVELSATGCLLLMSRGALPFAAPSHPEPMHKWWARDAGWRHGLGATVVVIAPTTLAVEGAAAISDLAQAIIQTRSD